MSGSPAEQARRSCVAGGLLLLAAGVLRLLEWAFTSRPIVAVVIGALLLDVWSQRLGARWSSVPSATGSSRTWLAAFAQGLGIGLLVVVARRATGDATMDWGFSSPTGLAIGSVRAGAAALRDQLLFRGIPLALLGPARRPWPLAFSACLGVAPLVLVPGVRVEAIALCLCSGFFFALVWDAGEGRAAWASQMGWLVAVQVVTRGAVEAEFKDASLSSMGGTRGVAGWVGATAFALSAWFFFRRKGAQKN